MIYEESVHKHRDYEDLEKSKHNLWVEFEEHKRSVKVLNEKLLKNKEIKGHLEYVVKLHEEIETSESTLGKFFGGTKCLDKLLRYCRCPTDKSRNGYEREINVHYEDTIVCYFCGKVGHMTSKCKDLPIKGVPMHFKLTREDPK